MGHPMIEPLGAKPLPSFSLQGLTTFHVHNVESPFIVHWLEWNAERLCSGPNVDVQTWNQVIRLFEAAHTVASIWSAIDETTTARIFRKLAHARAQIAGR